MKKASKPYTLSAWRAEFLDPAIEWEYREHVQEAVARHLRIALIGWAVLIMVFAFPDYQGLGAGPVFYQLLAMRLVQTALLLGLAWWVSRNPEVATNGWAVTWVEIAGLPMFFAIFFLRPDMYALNLGVIIILLISMYVYVPNRVVLTNLTALVAVVGTLISIRLIGTPWVDVVALVPALALPVITGFIATHRLQTLQRQEFTLLSEVRQTNEALAAEIDGRRLLEKELQRQATTDPLTGLFNRRQYEALFARERARCQRQGKKMVVGIVDLDHFKRINDTYGHDWGDQTLRHVAAILQGPLRKSDVLGRFGGEEFIVLLPDTELSEARRVTERLRLALEQAVLEHETDQVQITATFAITEVRPDDIAIAEIIRRVDEALYEGKRAGRNRVMISDEAFEEAMRARATAREDASELKSQTGKRTKTRSEKRDGDRSGEGGHCPPDPVPGV